MIQPKVGQQWKLTLENILNFEYYVWEILNIENGSFNAKLIEISANEISKANKVGEIRIINFDERSDWSLMKDIESEIIRTENEVDGDITYKKNGILHRLDGPARITRSGSRHWHKDGLRHREDGPAVEYQDGSKKWYQNDKKHRDDGPARIFQNGKKEYWINDVMITNEEEIAEIESKNIIKTENDLEIRYTLNDELHRLDGPALITNNGTKKWYKNGKRHRIGGPAVEHFTGTKQFFKEGLLHRLDGPACMWEDGLEQWYVEGKQYSWEEFFEKFHPLKVDNETIKLSEPTEALYRILTSQATRIIRNLLVRQLRTYLKSQDLSKKKVKSKLSDLKDFLQSSIGEAFLSLLIGYGMIFIPQTQIPLLQTASEEFRIQGLSIVGEQIINSFVSSFFNTITETIISLPEIEEEELKQCAY